MIKLARCYLTSVKVGLPDPMDGVERHGCCNNFCFVDWKIRSLRASVND